MWSSEVGKEGCVGVVGLEGAVMIADESNIEHRTHTYRNPTRHQSRDNRIEYRERIEYNKIG